MEDRFPVGKLTEFMRATVAYAEQHVADGGIPFTALVVGPDGRELGRGVNRVRCQCDVTAHAEVDAIRNAGHACGSPRLTGAILFASGEPCALCYMSALYAGVSRIYFSADRDEAAKWGFDYRGSYALLQPDPQAWQLPRAEKLAVEGSLVPFQLFLQGANP